MHYFDKCGLVLLNNHSDKVRFKVSDRQRLHQSLGYKTPEQFEAENAPAFAA
jgi:hypothetical protein